MPVVPHRLTASRLTPVGRGAVATIRVCANHAASVADALLSSTEVDFPTRDSSFEDSHFSALNSLFRAANGSPLAEQPLQKIAFGQWGETDGEDLVVCRVAFDVVEIYCHGGEAAVQRVLNDLSHLGCEIVDWRAQVALMGDVLESECLDVLSRTSTWRTTKIVLEQSNGLLRDTFERLMAVAPSIRRALINGTDQDSPSLACFPQVHSEETRDDAVSMSVKGLLQWADFGLHLSAPWNVVLTGRPNVGKSSLINALLGYQRAIVFDQPGTTRDVVTGETAFDGWPVVLADTAGIRDHVGGLEAAGIALARDRLQTADLQLVVVDISRQPTDEDEALLVEWPDALVVGHKSDLPNRWDHRLPSRAVCVSSITGDGLAELQQRLVDRLVPIVPNPGTPIPLTVRQIEFLKTLVFQDPADVVAGGDQKGGVGEPC